MSKPYSLRPGPKTALLSVSDKTDLDRIARYLIEKGFDLLASAGTARWLIEKGIAVRDVAEIVGPPILGHRVVTLSREIHAALLATDSPEDKAELERLGILRIDLVYVNFYPLEAEIKNRDSTMDSVVDKTDIGGPTLLRSAAKGRRMVMTRPEDFGTVGTLLTARHSADEEHRLISKLVAIAEMAVAKYCLASAGYHERIADNVEG